MNISVLNRFNTDLRHNLIECLFKEKDLWNELNYNGITEYGTFVDIEVDILDFLETHHIDNLLDHSSRQLMDISMFSKSSFQMQIEMDIYINNALRNHNDEFKNLKGWVNIIALYENFELVQIIATITNGEFGNETENNYELWPHNDFPKSFNGEFGYQAEMNDFDWKHLTSLLEVKMSVLDRQYDMKKWLNIQKILWLKICNKKKYNINDITKFLKFGKFFYDYVNKNHKSPSVNQVIGNIK